MNRKSVRWAFLCLLVAAATLTPTQRAADQWDPIRAQIRELLVDEPVPSIAVAVVRDGRIVWEEGFGWADRENRVRADEHTVYSLASVSKPITATGLMVLVERKKVDLDRPVNDYLGDVKLNARVGKAAEATVRRVAGHTAGLPLHYQFFYEDEPYRPPPMDETIRRYANLVTAPGERYQYSNLGYGVLDYVIARVSGKCYEDFLREELFLPLGMTRTSVGIGPRLGPNVAVRYNREGMPLPFYDFDHRGGSAVFSSAHDLALFAMLHLKTRQPDQRAVLSAAAIDEMQKPGMGDYGLGWSVSMRDAVRVVSHSGGMPGVATLLWLIPERQTGIVVLSNTSGVNLSRIGRAIIQALFPGGTQSSDGNPAPAPQRGFQPGSELVGTWQGAVHTYRGEVPLTLRIEGSGLIRARLGTQLETLLNSPAFREGYLTGRMAGDIGTEDSSRRPHVLSISLKLRGAVLNGAVSAISLPGPRGGNAQTYWGELKKQPGSPRD